MSEQQAAAIVTGSGGLIGRAVCEAFGREGYAVFGFDRPAALAADSGVSNVPCDLTSERSIAEAVEEVRRHLRGPLASVVHLAAYYDFSGEPSPLYDEVTVRGTERLLRLVQPLQPGQFVFSSTMLVHAPCEPGQHIDEDGPIEAKWDYPRSKVETERLVRAERGAVPAVLLRIAGVYTDRCQSVPLAHQAQRIYERRLTSKVFPGDTTHGQSFVHLEDVVGAFREALARRSTLPEEAAILIGEPDPPTYDELQRAFADAIHREPDWQTRQIPKAVAKAGAWVQDQIPGIEEPFIKPWMIDLADDHYALDISRAREILGWWPRHRLIDTVPTMGRALTADPDAFYRLNKLEGTPPAPEPATSRSDSASGQRG